MPTITEAWDRIHRWLAKHAPKILRNLNPGARRQEIASAEKALKMEMPAEWQDLYRVHNGMNEAGNFGSLFHGMKFLALEAAVADYRKDAASKKGLGKA